MALPALPHVKYNAQRAALWMHCWGVVERTLQVHFGEDCREDDIVLRDTGARLPLQQAAFRRVTQNFHILARITAVLSYSALPPVEHDCAHILNAPRPCTLVTPTGVIPCAPARRILSQRAALVHLGAPDGCDVAELRRQIQITRSSVVDGTLQARLGREDDPRVFDLFDPRYIKPCSGSRVLARITAALPALPTVEHILNAPFRCTLVLPRCRQVAPPDRDSARHSRSSVVEHTLQAGIGRDRRKDDPDVGWCYGNGELPREDHSERHREQLQRADAALVWDDGCIQSRRAWRSVQQVAVTTEDWPWIQLVTVENGGLCELVEAMPMGKLWN
ncbi:hypothetical protein B0H21DRAFT_820101 [Amylocystis lapponica]|nr:hypothetical protein B0H21DRAFT_820101 [Amylocystis lapponica]